MVVYSFNPSTGEAEAEKSGVCGQPEIHSEFLGKLAWTAAYIRASLKKKRGKNNSKIARNRSALTPALGRRQRKVDF